MVLFNSKQGKMKEKFNFVYETVKKAIYDLEAREIGVDQAKAVASLAKQANNVLSLQIEVSKFIAGHSDGTATDAMEKTGLIDKTE